MPAKKPAAAAAVPSTANVPAAERIREIAHRLWVEAGCPEGTAEADWFEAERIAGTELPVQKAKKAASRKKAA